MGSLASAEDLERLLRPYAEAVNSALDKWLSDPDVPATLTEAMRYASLDAGKRARPALVMLAAEAVAERRRWLADPIPAAVAVELAHCYSLVHDDLPAMDDDLLRRGRPTVHAKFGEAMAILAGSALLTRAFEVLTLGMSDPALAVRLVGELAAAAGAAGMLAGQVADMGLCDVPQGLEGRRYVHLRKTAALIRAAARMGAHCAGAGAEELTAMTDFAEKVGLAFQLRDDVLDATGTPETLGKSPGKDARSGKRTYATELGVEATGRLTEELTGRALAALEVFGARGRRLKDLAVLLCRRDR